MHRNTLGTTGLSISDVSFGTGSIGEVFGPVDTERAIRIVHEAIDLGIDLIDTAPAYGSAQERLGAALKGRRDDVVLATKAGRIDGQTFDFAPASIRRSLEDSLRTLGTDHVDVFQLHDIEFGDLDRILDESYAELVRLREDGLCRFIGMTGYPVDVMSRVIAEVDLDVILTYAHGTLLDASLADRILPLATQRGTGVLNAAAVALGLLTDRGTAFGDDHPARPDVREAADAMRTLAAEVDVSLPFLANQYSIQRGGAPTTVVGTATSAHLRSAIEASETPIDDDVLARFLALRPAVGEWLPSSTGALTA